jgi:hypothetical protein
MALALGSRFVLGFFREGTTPVFGPFNGMHVQALAGLVCVAAIISWNLTHPAAGRRNPLAGTAGV